MFIKALGQVIGSQGRDRVRLVKGRGAQLKFQKKKNLTLPKGQNDMFLLFQRVNSTRKQAKTHNFVHSGPNSKLLRVVFCACLVYGIPHSY